MQNLYLLLSNLETIDDNPRWSDTNTSFLEDYWSSPIGVHLVTDVVNILFLKRDPTTKEDWSKTKSFKDVVIVTMQPVKFATDPDGTTLGNNQPIWAVPMGNHKVFLFSYLEDNATFVFSVIDTSVVREAFAENKSRFEDLQQRRVSGRDIVISTEAELYPEVMSADDKALLWKNLQLFLRWPEKLKVKADADFEKLFGNMT